MAGSCVWNPGDKQAKPTSCIASPADSREVNGADGLAVCGPLRLAMLDDKSSRFGRGRADCIDGDPGSFLTLIAGGGPLRILRNIVLASPSAVNCLHEYCTYLLGDALPLELDLSTDPGCDCSPEPGDPLLLARLDAGSVLGGADETPPGGTIEANCRGETWRWSAMGGSVVTGGAATAVVMLKAASPKCEKVGGHDSSSCGFSGKRTNGASAG